ncbi:TnsA-like heteromeric transposase endonuclease subunit [Streptomyces sp. NPDC005227]|uniref:TnsA-like heteromeric transposase endonuclease subunit n=1 Tax=Streptomyces sp. NPDC005227 TaxID=3364707 RepID=UPI00367AC5BA
MTGFEACFLDPLGHSVQQRWTDAVLTVAFEDLPTVSAFPTVPGRRWGPGLWWSATTGGHVAAGSNAMRTQLMILDRDPHVVALAGRPVRLLWHTDRGQARSWTPQLFARYRDGTATLADCPSHAGAGGERALQAAEAIQAACAQVGWTYRRLQPPEEVLTANLKWLAGYRHPRNAGRPDLMPALLDAFRRPRPLMEGAEAVGDPLRVLPALYHALWHGHLTTSLETTLQGWAIVTAGPRDAVTAFTGRHHPKGSQDGDEAGPDSQARAATDASTGVGVGPTPVAGTVPIGDGACGLDGELS